MRFGDLRNNCRSKRKLVSQVSGCEHFWELVVEREALTAMEHLAISGVRTKTDFDYI